LEVSVANSIRRYEGRVVTVVGGTSGLGEGFAHRFASEGASVAVLDLDVPRGNAVATTVSTYGVEAMFSAVDVTDAESVVAAVVAFLGSDEASIITARSTSPTAATPPADALSGRVLSDLGIARIDDVQRGFFRREVTLDGIDR
jgi:NAD(P)-dependent dehydrogenase (short-subunit alcohol dehydrogenase family)